MAATASDSSEDRTSGSEQQTAWSTSRGVDDFKRCDFGIYCFVGFGEGLGVQYNVGENSGDGVGLGGGVGEEGNGLDGGVGTGPSTSF